MNIQEHGAQNERHDKIVVGKYTKALGRKVGKGGRWTVTDQHGVTFENDAGHQGTGFLTKVCHYCDLVSTSANFPGTGPSLVGELVTPLFQLDPNAKTTGGSLFTAAQAPECRRIFIQKVELEFHLSNFSNVPINGKIMYFLKRNTDQYTALDLWQASLEDESLAPWTTAAAFAHFNSGGAYVNPVIGADQPTMEGNDPRMYRSFKRSYKFLKSQKFELTSDSEVIIHTDVILNKILNVGNIKDMIGNPNTIEFAYGLKNYTVEAIIVYRTGLQLAKTELPEAEVTSAEGKIGATVKRRYVCKPMADSISDIRVNASIPYVIGDNTYASALEMMNVVDQIVAPDELE